MDMEPKREVVIDGDFLQMVLASFIATLAVAVFILCWWATPVGLMMGLVISAVAIGSFGVVVKWIARRGNDEEML
jgi:hypothetical protein